MNQEQYLDLAIGDVVFRGDERYVIVKAGDAGYGYWDMEGGPSGEVSLIEDYPMCEYWGTWTLAARRQPISRETQPTKCTIQVLSRKGA